MFHRKSSFNRELNFGHQFFFRDFGRVVEVQFLARAEMSQGFQVLFGGVGKGSVVAGVEFRFVAVGVTLQGC